MDFSDLQQLLQQAQNPIFSDTPGRGINNAREGMQQQLFPKLQNYLFQDADNQMEQHVRKTLWELLKNRRGELSDFFRDRDVSWLDGQNNSALFGRAVGENDVQLGEEKYLAPKGQWDQIYNFMPRKRM